MKKIKYLFGAITGLLSGFVLMGVSAVGWAEPLPALSFREVKITGNEFVVLVNSGTNDISHLNTYWLGYVGSDAADAVVPPSQQLPDVALKSGQALLLSGGGLVSTCDAAYVTSLAPSLSDSKGTLALWQAQADGSFVPLSGAQQRVSWQKPSASAPVLANSEIDLRSEAKPVAFSNPVWYFGATAGIWRVANLTGCALTTYSSPDDSGIIAASWPENDDQPPAVIVALADDGSAGSGPVLPLADVGLKPPQITELLPNPGGTGTDGTDEFIELYNSNTAVFDLSGFALQTGMTTKHTYTFPSGTLVPAKSFLAFYSADTGLSMSNTSGQAALLDPFGTLISQTDPYNSAKDGLTWALANGTWYWTTQPTPNAANVINQATASGSKTSGAKTAGQTKGATTRAATTSGQTAAATGAAPADATIVSPVHPGALALVAAAAVAYGLYEYRHDVANRFHQFKVYRDARRKARR